MKSSTRFPWSLLASAALLSIVAGLVLVASLALLVALSIPAQRDQMGGPAVLGVIFVIPASLVLFAEYRTVVRRDAKWANVIAAICLLIPVIGSFGFAEGLLSLIGVLPGGRAWSSWRELAVYATILALSTGIGFAHLRWSRVVKLTGTLDAGDLDS